MLPVQQQCQIPIVNLSEKYPNYKILIRDNEDDQIQALFYCCAIMFMYLMSTVGFLIEFVLKREDQVDLEVFTARKQKVKKKQEEKETRQDSKNRIIKRLANLNTLDESATSFPSRTPGGAGSGGHVEWAAAESLCSINED